MLAWAKKKRVVAADFKGERQFTCRWKQMFGEQMLAGREGIFNNETKNLHQAGLAKFFLVYHTSLYTGVGKSSFTGVST